MSTFSLVTVMPLMSCLCHIPSGHVSSSLKSYYLLNPSDTEALLYV